LGVYLRGKGWYIDFHYEGRRYTEKVGRVSKTVAQEKLIFHESPVQAHYSTSYPPMARLTIFAKCLTKEG